MKETIILVLKVRGGTRDREYLESIEGMDFNSIQDIRDTIFDEGALSASTDPDSKACYTLTEFMDACNDTDDDASAIKGVGYKFEASYIDISVNWIGYVNLIK